MPLALFGIEDGGLNLAVNLLLLVLVVVWLALVYYTFADARRRIADPVLVTTATLISLLIPFIGTVIYAILRPPEFLADVREREIETQASELRMRHLTAQSCPRCEHPIERSWLRCPECQHRLKDPCRSCSRPIDPRWAVCPYCETPLRRRSSEPDHERSRSRGKRTSEREPAGADSSGSSPAKPKRRKSAAERVSGGEIEPRGERPPPQAATPTEAELEPASQRPRRRSTTSS